MFALINSDLIPEWPASGALVTSLAETLGSPVYETEMGLLVSDVAEAQTFFSTWGTTAQQLVYAQKVELSKLADLFASKIAAGRVYTDGKTYQIDAASQAQIAAMGSLAASVVNNTPGSIWSGSFVWIASDNSQTPMIAAQMYAFAQNIASYVSGLILRNFALKQAITSATTMAQLQAIDITAGWPT